jgi:hypothetical protein
MSHARDRSMRLRRLCLEDTISTFSVAKDFMSSDDRFIQRVMFSDIHEVSSDGNRLATVTVDEFCNDLLSSVSGSSERGVTRAHVWLRGRALTGKTWIALRAMTHFAQAALDQLHRAEASNLELSESSLLPLPLFIPALKLARSRPATVESYIRSSHGLDASDELVRFLLEELERKRLVLFVDGMDDITRHRPLVVKYVEDVLLPCHPYVFLTSRVEALHWLSPGAFSSARTFATDAASFDSQYYPVFLEGMSSPQMAAMRYLLSVKFNLPPYDLVTSHSPSHPLIDCVGGLAIASSLVLRDAAPQCSLALVVQWCETYLRELLFAADSRKFVLISSDVDAERGRDQRLLGSPACIALLESIASLAIEKAVGAARRVDDAALSPVTFNDQHVSSVIEANPQFGGIWSCLFKSSPIINWGSKSSSSLPTYTFAHPFLLHLIVARATAARLHAGESIPWLVTRRIVFPREHRGLLFMLATILRSESFFKLISSLSSVAPLYRPCVFLLALAMISHRPNHELQSTDTKAFVASLKSNALPINSISSLVLHSNSPCLRAFALDILRVSDSGALFCLLADSLALLQAVADHAFPNSGETALRALACIHFLLKFVDEMKSVAVDLTLNHCRSVIGILSDIVTDSDQLECVRLEAVECMFTQLTAAMRAAPPHDASECDDRLKVSISASLSTVHSCDVVVRHSIYSAIKRVPFLSQVVADEQLHQEACLLIRSGYDDVRLFHSVATEMSCSQHERRLSAVLAAECLSANEDMRALVLAHLRDSSRIVRVAVASALKAFTLGDLSVIEVHNISNCLCVSLLLESVPEVVAAFTSVLAVIFPRLISVPSVAVDAMQQHPAVFDLLSHWICQQHSASPRQASAAKEVDVQTLGSEFLTLEQLLRKLLVVKSRRPPQSASISCKLILIFALLFESSGGSLAGLTSHTHSRKCDELAEISAFLKAAAASVGSQSGAVNPAAHSSICAFIRMCGSPPFIPLFLGVDVPHLLSVAGVRHNSQLNVSSASVLNADSITPQTSASLMPQHDFELRQVSFSTQTFMYNSKTLEVALSAGLATDLDPVSDVDVLDDVPSHSASSNQVCGQEDAVRSQLANEFVLELISSVQSCIQSLGRDDPRCIAAACNGACACACLILSNHCAFEISQDLLCQALSLISAAGVLSVYLASEIKEIPVSFQDIFAAVLSCCSHPSSRVRVGALQALSSEFSSLTTDYALRATRMAEFPFLYSDVADTLARMRRVLIAALSDDSDIVVSRALSTLVASVPFDQDVSLILFDSVASSLKETLTLCLSKAEGRSKGVAKVQVLLEYTVSALFSDSPPSLDRIQRSCTEIRRICKWFPSSHKPPLCAQPLRSQAIKAASKLLSCKRLVTQV